MWIDEETILSPADGPSEGSRWVLRSSPDARANPVDVADLSYEGRSLDAADQAAYGWVGEVWALRPRGLDRDEIAHLLTTQLVVARILPDGSEQVTGMQLAGVIDDIYASAKSRQLGIQWDANAPTLAVWAPTAQNLALLRYDDPADGHAAERLPAKRQPDGSWTVTGSPDWIGSAYLYEVTVYAPSTQRVEVNTVTDPYSIALTANSTRSIMIDLEDPAWKPESWTEASPPVIRNSSARTIYELHVRDLSIHDASLPSEVRGTYTAFTREGEGRQHLRELANAGLNTVHLLPTFDIASIEELRGRQREPSCDVDAGPDWAEQQACVMSVADQDGYNWGYDPLHFLAPEGSYAIHADGGKRVREFREMVGALHEDGLQVVLDVVFNHTAGAGQTSTSILDRVVPGYYQRLNTSGEVETSTCCANLATEHAMTEKLMVDALVLWAREYHVDGFRFDLMGHSSRPNLEAVRAALDHLTPETDGVDGASMYLYGEGWNFGEIADNARFQQASQGQLGGTDIGTFNDRLRDAVHGGSPGDAASTFAQGFGTGLVTAPNGEPANGSQEEAETRLAQDTDLIKIALAGNLRSFRFLTAEGTERRGDEIPFGAGAAAYGDQPGETVNYVDAHDNETLYDLMTLKLPIDTSMSDRVRMNTLALATTTLSQSPSLWHAGTDLLRSKSMDRNSYNSGDWFNAIDWAGRSSNFGVGLPPAADNEYRWDILAPRLRDPDLRPTAADIADASAQAQTLLSMKRSTPLFSLGDADLIEEKLTFPVGGPNSPPGVIVMSIDDTIGPDIDPRLDGVLVGFNVGTETIQLSVRNLQGREFQLAPEQRAGDDGVVKASTWTAATGTLSIPARTVAVFVLPSQAQPTPRDSADATRVVTSAIVGAAALALVSVLLTLFIRRRVSRLES
jgi:pullulanase-type alpha-1,6-glucosidase